MGHLKANLLKYVVKQSSSICIYLHFISAKKSEPYKQFNKNIEWLDLCTVTARALKSFEIAKLSSYCHLHPITPTPHLTVTVKGMAVGVDLAVVVSSLSLATGLGSSFGRLTSRGWHTMRRRDDFFGAWSFHSAIAPPCPDWTHKLQDEIAAEHGPKGSNSFSFVLILYCKL